MEDMRMGEWPTDHCVAENNQKSKEIMYKERERDSAIRSCYVKTKRRSKEMG
jgi:hypothetical protein